MQFSYKYCSSCIIGFSNYLVVNCKSRAGRHQMTLSCLLFRSAVSPECHRLLPETTICKTKPLWVHSAPESFWIVWMLWQQRSVEAAVLHRSLHRSIQNPHPELTGCSRSAGICPFVLCSLGLDGCPLVPQPSPTPPALLISPLQATLL